MVQDLISPVADRFGLDGFSVWMMWTWINLAMILVLLDWIPPRERGMFDIDC